MPDEYTASEAIEYVRWCLGRPKRDVSGERLAQSLLTCFQHGYNGNHQPFPANSLKLFRGRIAHDGIKYSSLSELWYPKNTPSLSRASFGGSVFYCSYGNATALLELSPAPLDTICMMECSTLKEMLNVKWITNNGILNLHQMSEPFGAFERLCSDAFCWRVHKKFDYVISGALASLFFTFSNVDGLAYSSSATAMKGVNLALKTTIADEFVTPRSFHSYRVLDVYWPSDFLVQCTGYAPAPDERGKIEWGGLVDCPGHRVSNALFERPIIGSLCGNAALGESREAPEAVNAAPAP
jgi:hypothetical protein